MVRFGSDSGGVKMISGIQEGVKGYKQIHLKKFSKVISHNLRLLALSRDLPLYELHDQIITDFTENAKFVGLPALSDQCSYNVFISPKAQERVAALSASLKIPESEIFYSALYTFAAKNNLSKPLDRAG